MHTIIRRYELVPDTDVDALLRLVHDGYLPLVVSAPGFISYQMLRTGERGVCTISTFVDRETATSAAQQSAAWVQQTVVHLLAGPPQITSGDVGLAATAPGGLPRVVPPGRE